MVRQWGAGRLADMSGQRVATWVGLAALAVLLLSVGAPALLPPEPVPAIEIVTPTDSPSGQSPGASTDPPDDDDEWDDDWDEPDDDDQDDDDTDDWDDDDWDDDSADSPDDDDDDD
jgi:hypothetical protein